MKLTQNNNTLETNSTGESKSFGIGNASVVIEILRNKLYENKIQTLVQEYICNARDAMREVGKGNDFQITMPTRLQPTFKVRDFGPGISPDRMENVFRLYGASTKRDNNHQTGGFGIGAKSAWSYTDSFTVVTIFNGTRRTYVCHTGRNNEGSLDLTSEAHTDEANGTEIQVAVKQNDIGEFQTSVYRAIYFWESRPEVKGANEATPTLTAGYKISANIETIDKNMLPHFVGMNYHDKAIVVIDGVPYPMTSKLLAKATRLAKFLDESLRKVAVIHLPNGIVDVSASRESISDNQISIDALDRMGTQGTELVRKHLKSEFSKVKTTGEWIETYSKLVSYFDVEKEAKFGDYVIENGRIQSENLKGVKITLAHCLDKRGRHKVDRISKEVWTRPESNNIPIELLDNCYVVTTEENAIVQNKRLRHFFAGQSKPQFSKVFLIESLAGDKETLAKVVSDLNVKTFESITFPVVEREAKVKIERENAEFCMHTFNSSGHRYTTLAKNTTKYLYVPIGKAGTWEGFGHKSQLQDLADHVRSTQQIEIVGVAERALKMIKGNSNFILLKDWIAEYKPTKAEINYTIRSEARNNDDMETLVGLEGIQDEFLNDMIKEYKGILGEARKLSRIPALLQGIVKAETNAKEFVEKDTRLSLLLKSKYPLVSEIGRHADKNVKNELVFYINAKYN
jgi:hypothetical protein